jgi:SAM-dependent methyltransferase
MKKFHISQAHDKIGPHGNLTFWISMIKESQAVLKPNVERTILDFGCGDGKFLQLFDLMDDLKYGLGLELDEDLINQANQENHNELIHYELYQENILQNKDDYFDVVYSQETLYTIKNLKFHAEAMFACLKKGGFYFATMGCHIDNPLWSKRRKIIRDEEKYFAYDYSIEEVAEVFHSVGFEVAIKRLPVEYFLVYHPEFTKDFSNSLLDLVKTTYENKMLFLFWKES